MTARTTDELAAGLDAVRAAPTLHGRLDLVVRRPAVDQREVLDAGALDITAGLVGDTWPERPSRDMPDGAAHPLRQLTVMSSRAAALLGGEVERWPLFGDQLYVDLDISEANLPAGTRLAIGDAVVEITAPPHLGCAKFTQRFGLDAMHFVNSDEGKALRLRGANARVVTGGTVRPGDAVTRLVG